MLAFRGRWAYLATMTLVFPTLLPVPIAVAATSEVLGNVSAKSPARDLAWIFVACSAATMVGQDRGGYWLLDEKALRAAVGLKGKQRWDVEAERWERLEQSKIRIGSHLYPAPTVRERAITSAGEAHWSIDPGLVEQWAVYEQTQTVYVPLRLLQLSKSRTTIMLALRALAWRSGAAPTGSMLAADDNSSSLRLSVADLRRELGLDGVETKYLLRDHLVPAAVELEKLMVGIKVAIEPVWTLRHPRPTTIRRRAQILGFDLHLTWDNAALAPAKKLEFGALRWRRGDQSRMRRPKPAPLFDHAAPPADNGDNVVEFKPLSGFRQLRSLRTNDED